MKKLIEINVTAKIEYYENGKECQDITNNNLMIGIEDIYSIFCDTTSMKCGITFKDQAKSITYELTIHEYKKIRKILEDNSILLEEI